jgi:hypothetical protein
MCMSVPVCVSSALFVCVSCTSISCVLMFYVHMFCANLFCVPVCFVCVFSVGG